MKFLTNRRFFDSSFFDAMLLIGAAVTIAGVSSCDQKKPHPDDVFYKGPPAISRSDFDIGGYTTTLQTIKHDGHYFVLTHNEYHHAISLDHHPSCHCITKESLVQKLINLKNYNGPSEAQALGIHPDPIFGGLDGITNPPLTPKDERSVDFYNNVFELKLPLTPSK